MMNYANLFWQFGHPEVYIRVPSSFGICSDTPMLWSLAFVVTVAIGGMTVVILPVESCREGGGNLKVA